MRPDGVAHLEQRYTFASDDGGTVGLPQLADATGVIGGATNVTLDGAPAVLTNGTFEPQLRVKAEHATVAYDVVRTI